MDFDFSDEQKSLMDQAQRVLAEHGDALSRRKVFEREAPFNAALWNQITDLGWTGAAIPQAYGGLELGYVTLCGFALEIGRALAPVPFASSIFVAAEAILLAGTEAQKATHLPELIAGRQIGALALTEGLGPIVPTRLTTTYANGRVTGRKIAVIDGGVADIAIVAAVSDGATGLFLVHLDGEGVLREAQDGIDPSRPLHSITFDGAPAEPLDAWQGAGDVIERLLARASILTAFEQLGGAEAALAMAKTYALERHAFGRPIGGFQAIKHKLAEVYVSIELARSQAYYAAWALEADDPSLIVAAASARLAAIAAFEQAAADLIQVHGGIGMTWEHDSHLFYRRSRHLAVAFGDAGQWRETLMAELTQAAA